jgi:hypothetical protein
MIPCIIELAKYLRKHNFVVGKKDNFQSWTTSYNGSSRWHILTHFGSKEAGPGNLVSGKS